MTREKFENWLAKPLNILLITAGLSLIVITTILCLFSTPISVEDSQRIAREREQVEQKETAEKLKADRQSSLALPQKNSFGSEMAVIGVVVFALIFILLGLLVYAWLFSGEDKPDFYAFDEFGNRVGVKMRTTWFFFWWD